ncbi:MAG: AraC family transcriptional regulator ligand-binding domain-containing protein [Pseudomonadota bacterium]
MEQINQACGVSGLDLVNPLGRGPDDVAPRLWRALEQECPSEALTLRMAKAAPFSCYAGLAEGMQFATDLRQALGLLIKNRIVIADRLELRLIERDESAVLTGGHPIEEIDNGRTSELMVALLIRMIREFLGAEDAVERIGFSWGPWGSPAAYRLHFGVPVDFHEPRTEIVFRQDRMKTAISHANTALFAYVAQHFAQVADSIAQESFPAQFAKLREAIVCNAAIGEFGGRAAAARASMSLRSAQRLTAAHGSSLRRLIDQIRATCAKEFLSDSRFTIEKVAQLVGYSDDRAFRRAFKRWTGQTPSQYRAP